MVSSSIGHESGHIALTVATATGVVAAGGMFTKEPGGRHYLSWFLRAACWPPLLAVRTLMIYLCRWLDDIDRCSVGQTTLVI